MSSTSDQVLSISDVQRRLDEFAQARDWGQFHSPKNLALSLSIEAGELLEVFQWLSEGESRALKDDEASRDRVSEELADVLIYALRLADVLDIPLVEAVERKIKLNEERYPVDLAKGNAIKYSRRSE